MMERERTHTYTHTHKQKVEFKSLNLLRPLDELAALTPVCVCVCVIEGEAEVLSV